MHPKFASLHILIYVKKKCNKIKSFTSCPLTWLEQHSRHDSKIFFLSEINFRWDGRMYVYNHEHVMELYVLWSFRTQTAKLFFVIASGWRFILNVHVYTAYNNKSDDWTYKLYTVIHKMLINLLLTYFPFYSVLHLWFSYEKLISLIYS